MNLAENQTHSSWCGQVDLTYGYHQQQTKVNSAFAQAPFKIQRPFYPEGKQICHSVILHTAGGIVAGDRLVQKIHLQPQAQVLITTPAASKIYRSQGKIAAQNITINLEANSYLEYLPQETIVFNQAQFQQKLRVELGEDATWLSWEIIRFGRTARQEIFDTGVWRNYTEIWQQGKPLWIDRQYFPGELFFAANGLNGKPVIANLICVGRDMKPDTINAIRELKINSKISITGVTQLQMGLLCRYHGYSVADAKPWLIQIWQLLRQLHDKPQPAIPRVW